jgi:hypothetical protein
MSNYGLHLDNDCVLIAYLYRVVRGCRGRVFRACDVVSRARSGRNLGSAV